MKTINITHTLETLPHATLHPHEELPFWRRYVFSTDHKVIWIWYALTSMFFLFVGFSLMMLMRWQLAYNGEPIPLIGSIFGDERAPGGVMLPEFYNQLGAMHGTIMVFLGVVPLAVGAFGLDLLSSALRHHVSGLPGRSDLLAAWNGFPDHLIASRFDKFYNDDSSAPGEGPFF